MYCGFPPLGDFADTDADAVESFSTTPQLELVSHRLHLQTPQPARSSKTKARDLRGGFGDHKKANHI